MEEIRISGQIAYSMQEEDRVIKFDCGTGMFIKDFILHDCGGYNVGDRVTITISPCKEDEYHYPPKPKSLPKPSFLQTT